MSAPNHSDQPAPAIPAARPQLLKAAEVADRLSCSTRSVWRLRSLGELPAVELPGVGTRFRECDVEALIHQQATG